VSLTLTYDPAMSCARPAVLLLASLAVACASPDSEPADGSASTSPALSTPQETHLSNVRQLTFGGQNAEAYFSFDGQYLSFQSTGEHACDQIYTMRIDGSDRRLISTGQGRTTCSHYTPDGKSIVYASTHLGGVACPPEPGFEQGYVWPVYDSYDIFKVDVDGSNLTRLTDTPGYDAEATIGPDGTIVFTSVRDGDMEIYSMNADGSNVRRLTNMPGPDGGPFFSADGSKIVFRGRHPEPGPELQQYQDFLKKALWQPTSLEIYVMNPDGSNLQQVTSLGGASFAPFFTPDGSRIIFSSNHHDPQGREFDLFLINVDGTGLEQVTHSPDFDGFPMFSPDGTKLVFASNRNGQEPRETNLFIADWR
jgi:Tol biopolymer transport system component